MQSSSEQPLVGEERYVTTRITAAKETKFPPAVLPDGQYVLIRAESDSHWDKQSFFDRHLNSQEGCRCVLVPRLSFPVPRSPFPVPRSPFPVPRSPFLVLVTSRFAV